MARSNRLRVRKVGDLRRKQPTREPYDRILIVCEGKKTEPNYFEEIRKEERIPTAHIYVLHSQFGTQPLQVVKFAEENSTKPNNLKRYLLSLTGMIIVLMLTLLRKQGP